MTERVWCGVLGDTGGAGSGGDGALDSGLVQMVAPDLAGLGVQVCARRREQPLPPPLARRVPLDRQPRAISPGVRPMIAFSARVMCDWSA